MQTEQPGRFRSVSRSPDIRSRLKMYFVMGSPDCAGDPKQTLAAAIRGGITAFQFREKGEGALSGEAAYQLAAALKNQCEKAGVLFLVNDDADLALRLNADGVHVGQEDEPPAAVRRKLGKDKIIGVSAHNVQEALLAAEQGADYIGVGPMYETKTKKDARAVCGPEMIREMRLAGISLPIVGIGGITPDRALPVIQAGADGVAVVSAISRATDPQEAVHAFYRFMGKV